MMEETMREADTAKPDIDLRGHFPWPGVMITTPPPEGESWFEYLWNLVGEYQEAVAHEVRSRGDYEARKTPSLRFSPPMMAAFLRSAEVGRRGLQYMTPGDDSIQPKTIFGCPVFTDSRL